MSNRKNYTAPFGILVLVICVQLFLWWQLIDFTIGMERLKARTGYGNLPSAYVDQCIEEGIIILILIAECIVLWRIRKKPFKRIFVWLYILLLFCVLVIFPCLGWASGFRFYRLLKPDDPSIYWIFMGMAHVFFAITLVQVYSRRKAFVPTDPANILEDYAEE